MKVSIDTKLYAVMNSNTKELVSRYTGGFFWTRQGDAMNKLRQMRNGNYELVTCSLTIDSSINGPELIRKENEDKAAKKMAAHLRELEITKLKNELKELTGLTDVPTIKTFLIKTVLVPDYKLKIENVIGELTKLNYSKV